MSTFPTAAQVALIGLSGVLTGALLGLVGSLVSTSRQIARQERDARRSAYGRYIGAALDLSSIQDRQRLNWQETLEGRRMVADVHESLRTSRGRQERKYWNEGLGEVQEKHEVVEVEHRELGRAFQTKFDAFVSASHEQRIHAPDLVHDAAMLLYYSVSTRTAFDTPEAEDGRANWGEALKLYSDLARADVKSPGATSWVAQRKKSRARVQQLTGVMKEAAANAVSYRLSHEG